MAEVEIDMSLKKARRFKRHLERTHPSVRGKVKIELTEPEFKKALRKIRFKTDALVSRNSFVSPRFDVEAKRVTNINNLKD